MRRVSHATSQAAAPSRRPGASPRRTGRGRGRSVCPLLSAARAACPAGSGLARLSEICGGVSGGHGRPRRAGTPEGADEAKPGETGIRDLAYSHLTEAIQTIPEEPAAWADRGLWFVRNNRLKEAALDLGQAERLAPHSPEIQRILGLLYKKDGKYGEAARRFRQALAKDPKDLPTLYALTQALDQEAGEGSDQESLKLLNQALAIQPNNLRLLHAKGILAVRLGDQQALDDVVAAYRRLEPGWSGSGAADAHRLLDTLAGQARGLVGEAAAFTLNVLNNNLQAEFAYSRDFRAVEPDEQNQGEAVEQFLSLTPMRASPSPPDTASSSRSHRLRVSSPRRSPAGAGTWRCRCG